MDRRKVFWQSIWRACYALLKRILECILSCGHNKTALLSKEESVCFDCAIKISRKLYTSFHLQSVS